jgi:hypothetical protein
MELDIMATIEFYAGEGSNINNLSGSGLGFYGDSGFGYSVAVGSYQGRTFITDSTGTSQGPEADNCKFLNTSGVVVGQTGSGISLISLPNYLATLNVRFTHSSTVKVQNAKMYGYDRVNKNNSPSGVTLKGAEIIHTNTIQNATGSGDVNWVTMTGSGSVLDLVGSPGISGLSPNGLETTQDQHDWYVALTATPQSVGAKEFGAFIELEYL